MNLRGFSIRIRPWIAMIAAYAVALQMLLSVTVAGQHAALAAIAPDLASAICLTGGNAGSNSEDPSRPPVSPASCVLCAMAASDGAPHRAALAVPQAHFGVAFAWVSTPAVAARRPISPRLSQGPPQIA